MRFEHKVALVTGAASGIGRALAQRLAKEGARLALVDCNEEGLRELAQCVPDGAAGCVGCFDIAEEAQVEKFVGEVVAKYGRLDVLCNNAGIAGGSHALATDQDATVWNQVLAVNVMGAVFFTKYAARQMKAQGSGAIVNTASVAGIRSGAGGNAYSASKAALINFTMTCACDLGVWNIRVNAVCPGLIETGMTRPIFERARAEQKMDRLGSRCELRRYGRAEEVAAAIAFLASEDASYITGQALAVDGGNTASLNMPGMKV